MTLSNGQQAFLYAIALFLVGLGAYGSADQLKAYGFPPIVGFAFITAGMLGGVIIHAYGLGQQTALRIRNASLTANKPSNGTPDTTPK